MLAQQISSSIGAILQVCRTIYCSPCIQSPLLNRPRKYFPTIKRPPKSERSGNITTRPEKHSHITTNQSLHTKCWTLHGKQEMMMLGFNYLKNIYKKSKNKNVGNQKYDDIIKFLYVSH